MNCSPTFTAILIPPTTGLRFFTVYGPWGRPDMLLQVCVQAILQVNQSMFITSVIYEYATLLILTTW